jgi:hypothetical protein
LRYNKAEKPYCGAVEVGAVNYQYARNNSFYRYIKEYTPKTFGLTPLIPFTK